jgi:ribosomal protein S18 acetylase RimI-like enzyme
MEIVAMQPGDEARVLAAGVLFDDEPTEAWTTAFLAREGHHLLIAYVDDEAAGFVSGVETIHPDKGIELFLYELGVDEAHRRTGIAKALLERLETIAVEHGCRGMWVATEADNVAALATYRSARYEAPAPCVVLERAIGPGGPRPAGDGSGDEPPP